MQAERRNLIDHWHDMRADFGVDRIISTVATGVVLGAVNALLGIALVSLIFQGELSGLLPVGIGLGLTASFVIAVTTAVGSSVGGMYAGVQDASAAILGLSAAALAVGAGTATEDTVISLIIVTSLTTGVTLLLMGRFRLGEVSRYLPFPVIGGLLAGTGYLIVSGSVEILGGWPRDSVFDTQVIGLFWPGVSLAVVFFVASRMGWPSKVYLWALLTAVVGFHLALAVLDIGQAEAAGRGWMLGPFPDGSLWPGFALTSLAEANWGLVLAETPSILTVLLIVPMTVVLYISALEVEMKRDIDPAVELKTTGWANVAAAAVGGPPGYIYLADTVVTRRLVGGRRGSALVAAIVVGLVVMVGGFLLESLPQFVVGGLLLFVGFDFLAEWLWSARHKMAPVDYLLMVAIVVMVATVGFLAGVAAGLVIAIVLFVVRYSKIEVVKHALAATEYRSNIERAPGQMRYLESVGESVLILLLQGFIFFGTANRINAQVSRRLLSEEPLMGVVLDFRLVTGIDSSALMTFERLCTIAEDHDFTVVLVGLGAERSHLEDLIRRYGGHLRVEADLDRGVAWCEEQLLAAAPIDGDSARNLPQDLEARLMPYLEARSFPAGATLMNQGDSASGLHLIVSGRANVMLEGPDGDEARLRSLLEGTIIGEISLYHDEPVTAKVVAETPCETLHLSLSSFDHLCSTDSQLAADLHSFVARTLAARVSHANRAIRALRR